jgi:aminoglycoside 6'-N-acetyltransferase
MSEPEASEFVAEMATTPLFQPGAWVQLAIARTADDALVGDVGLFLAEDCAFAEVGFTVAPKAQARGYASAAVAAAIQLLFERTSAARVIAVTDARNTASVKVLERVGMSRVESRETLFKGEPGVEWVYARSRDG